MTDSVKDNRDYWIGGSDIPAIMGVSSFSTTFELAKDKLGLTPSGDSKDIFMEKYVDFGNTMEPLVRDYINEKYGVSYEPISHKLEDERIRVNVDGFDINAPTPLLEIKTYGDSFRGEEFEWQIQAYMYALNVDKCLLVGYHRTKPESLFSFDDFDMEFKPENITEILVTREQGMIDEMLERVPKFIEQLEHLRENPDYSEMDFTLALGDNQELATRMNEFDETIRQFNQIKELVAREKEIKEEMRQLMLAHDIVTIETDENRLTASSDTTSMRFDSKAFKSDHPELFEKYQTPSSRKGSLRVTPRK